MTDMIFPFHTRQEAATARAACKRMLAAKLHLTTSQRDTLTRTLATLETVGSESGSTSTVLDPGMQAALVTALHRLSRHTIGAGPTGDSPAETLLARLPQLAPWPMPNPEVAQFVRLGFGDAHGLTVSSLSFAVDMPDLPTLEICLCESIVGYNHFKGQQVAESLAPLWDDLSTITIGRASSPFVQIRVPFTRQQRNGGDNSQAIALEPAERDTVIDALVAATRTCHADSVLFIATGHLEPTPHRPAATDVSAVRMWWD